MPSSPNFEFLLDENVSKNLKKLLQSKGFEAKTVQELKKQTIKNTELLKLARQFQYILITYDKDFLYYSYLPSDSVIVVDIFPMIDEKILPSFKKFLNKISANDLKGNFIILYENRFKIKAKVGLLTK
ncbi:MAG TPA: DUF5615 family PIN-like protein [Candidatus Deferrimicrobium sp.]|nr:DUF5615 family PIN-like protein [Candidatus Deferrimicrobium sp.]